MLKRVKDDYTIDLPKYLVGSLVEQTTPVAFHAKNGIAIGEVGKQSSRRDMTGKLYVYTAKWVNKRKTIYRLRIPVVVADIARLKPEDTVEVDVDPEKKTITIKRVEATQVANISS